MPIQIQLRHDTAANWTAANPTLADGEVGVETDTNRLKLGDGATAWNSLAYYTTSTIEDESFGFAPVETGGHIAITTGARRFYNRTGRTLTIRYIVAAAGVAPVGADIIFDVNVDGTTIWSTQANRVKIVDGANEGHQTTFNTTSIADGSYFTVDVDQVGSPGTEGSGTSIIIWTRG